MQWKLGFFTFTDTRKYSTFFLTFPIVENLFHDIYTLL